MWDLPGPGMEPVPLQWKHGGLTSGSPRSPNKSFRDHGGDLLGGPVAKTALQCRWCGFDLWLGKLGSLRPCSQKAKTWNRSSMVTHSIKTLKMVHIKKYIYEKITSFIYFFRKGPWCPPLRVSLEPAVSKGPFTCTLFGGLHQATHGMLVPRPGIEPRPSAVVTLGRNHWATREFALLVLYLKYRWP